MFMRGVAGRQRAKAALWLAGMRVDTSRRVLQILHHGRPISACAYRCESMARRSCAVAMAGQPLGVRGSVAESTPSKSRATWGLTARKKQRRGPLTSAVQRQLAPPWPANLCACTVPREHSAAVAHRNQPAASRPRHAVCARAREVGSSPFGKRSNTFIIQSNYVHISGPSGLSDDILYFSNQFN